MVNKFNKNPKKITFLAFLYPYISASTSFTIYTTGNMITAQGSTISNIVNVLYANMLLMIKQVQNILANILNNLFLMVFAFGFPPYLKFLFILIIFPFF